MEERKASIHQSEKKVISFCAPQERSGERWLSNMVIKHWVMKMSIANYACLQAFFKYSTLWSPLLEMHEGGKVKGQAAVTVNLIQMHRQTI